MEALTLLIEKGLVWFDQASNAKDIERINGFISTFCFESAHWILSPCKIQKSNAKLQLLLNLWIARASFVAKWITSLLKFYDYGILYQKQEKIYQIVNLLELSESNILVFLDNGVVDSVNLRFFSLIRILNLNYDISDLSIVFESHNSGFIKIALDKIDDGNDKEIDSIDLEKLIKVI